MPLEDHFNATVTISRKTRSGDDDGTPLYETSTVIISGWWDELETRLLEEPFRNESIPYMDRRALFLCLANADIQQDDDGTVLIGGMDRGKWAVSIVRAVPVPSGVGHIEVQFQGTKESL